MCFFLYFLYDSKYHSLKKKFIDFGYNWISESENKPTRNQIE